MNSNCSHKALRLLVLWECVLTLSTSMSGMRLPGVMLACSRRRRLNSKRWLCTCTRVRLLAFIICGMGKRQVSVGAPCAVCHAACGIMQLLSTVLHIRWCTACAFQRGRCCDSWSPIQVVQKRQTHRQHGLGHGRVDAKLLNSADKAQMQLRVPDALCICQASIFRRGCHVVCPAGASVSRSWSSGA